MTLHEVPVGTMARVAASPRTPVHQRLATLGLREGIAVHVMRRTSGGGRLLGIGPSRLAVDRATLQSLHVEPVQ